MSSEEIYQNESEEQFYQNSNPENEAEEDDDDEEEDHNEMAGYRKLTDSIYYANFQELCHNDDGQEIIIAKNFNTFQDGKVLLDDLYIDDTTGILFCCYLGKLGFTIILSYFS